MMVVVWVLASCHVRIPGDPCPDFSFYHTIYWLLFFLVVFHLRYYRYSIAQRQLVLHAGLYRLSVLENGAVFLDQYLVTRLETDPSVRLR